MNGSIIVVAHVRDDALRPKVGERLADLESFYALDDALAALRRSRRSSAP